MSLVGILHRPVNGLRFSGSTLPLPLGTLALMLIVGSALYSILTTFGLSQTRSFTRNALFQIVGLFVHRVKLLLATLLRSLVQARQVLGVVILIGALAATFFVVSNVNAAAPRND